MQIPIIDIGNETINPHKLFISQQYHIKRLTIWKDFYRVNKILLKWGYHGNICLCIFVGTFLEILFAMRKVYLT